ncbi:MAG TPA: MarR family transcriptional regulator [Exiguobacterium sp.]|uniref:MarR family winged helix-turn-helix transcriptional regulator n=1 Tax=Exiguobacterium sp. TaxID=44751 RepID=UPI000EB95390|nr:MarR family transcriptional regulator [Exiguobacterium sp.]HCN56681.1 MarR family transcriptional regulator [Exiguobacterium sp.]
MEQDQLFKMIHTVEAVTNEAIIDWNTRFPHKIGISPILTLGELKRKGPQNQMKLAETLGFTGGAMTNIAKKLIQLELVERVYNEQDRRQVLLQITEQGEQILSEAQAIGTQQYLELYDVLDEEEIRLYLAINEKLLTHIREKRENGVKR